MSLSQNILNNVDTIVRSYISNISKKYKINESELVNLWYGSDTQIQSKESSEESNELSKLTKNEIIEMCKTKNIKVSGTKNELISRLLECNKKTTPQISITKKLIEKIPKIEIKKNVHGNYEHLETTFVINNKTQKVYGKQNKDGTISNLTTEDINLCNKYKFSYELPTNLEKKINILDVKVDDLDDDDIEYEDDLDEEVEEEEVEEEEIDDDFYDDI
jgi:hypothetical protein